jgi:MoxR-like ATPase
MTREEVLLTTRTKLQEIGLPKMKSEVGKTFFEMDRAVEALYYALTSGLNIILYGPGGFGKTQVVKKFLEVAGLSSSTIVGYEDMEVDGLLGVVDIKKLTDEAVYEIRFEKSVFANPGVLILEEFLDARPSTAAALKDILTEGGYRRGSEFVESLISSVIICTNKSPDEMSRTTSTAAFYRERFPIVVNVSWSNFDTQTYLKFLQHIKLEKYAELTDEYLIIAELAARTSASGLIVSPRIVKYASDLIDLHKTVLSLTHLAGLDTSDMSNVISICKSKTEKIRIVNLVSGIKAVLAGMKEEETYSIGFINTSLGQLDYIFHKLDGLAALTPENFALVVAVRSECSDMYDVLNKKIARGITDPERNRLDKLFTL